MNYKEILSFQPTLTPSVIDYINKLQSGQLTLGQFHNKKHYARKTKNLIKILELTVAWEIFNMIGKDDV